MGHGSKIQTRVVDAYAILALLIYAYLPVQVFIGENVMCFHSNMPLVIHHW